jgi:DNA-binding beta-propeller fold protein YncE
MAYDAAGGNMRLDRFGVTLVLVALVWLSCRDVLTAQTNWEVVKTFQIGGQGGWDYLTLDPQTHRLFVPRTTHTMVIDAGSGAVIADIPGQKNAHGVALAPALGRGFISDGGGDGAVVVFDLKTYSVLGTIVAKPDADGIIFDEGTDRVYMVSGRGKALMSFAPTIDPSLGKIEAAIDLRGEPEFLAADGAGKVYINLMDTNEVAVVDTKARQVLAHWPVAPGGKPVGMSMDTNKRRLFIGCRGPQKLIVMSTIDGKVLSNLPIGESVDATRIDGDQVFASTAGGALSVARETSPGIYAIVQTVKTGPGARTMAVDPTTHRLYLPTADYDDPKPGAPARPKPGTFKILVVAGR